MEKQKISTEELKVGDVVRLSHSNLTYKIICLDGEKVWMRDLMGVVSNAVVDKKYLTKMER